MDNDIQVLRNRHFAIMDMLLAHPEWNQKDVAESLNYSESWLSSLVNSSLFQTAFRTYRQRYEEALRGSIVAATTEAIKVSVEIMKDKGSPAVIRQQSARDILAQGHAKAVEKRASLSLTGEVPAELLPRMEVIMKELDLPFAPKKLLVRPEESMNKDEV
jgi:hypothetical protein